MSHLSPITHRPVRVGIAGAGGRGTTYAEWIAENPARARVVAVADQDAKKAQQLATRHEVSPDRIFKDWAELAQADIELDAVLICTDDRDHLGAVQALAPRGWSILLEKPMGVTEQECHDIVSLAEASDAVFAVCHVMRYTPYTRAVRSVVESGVLGTLVSIQHLEPIGWWHFAHSYVRGNWASSEASSPMILAKSCHDLDWMSYLASSRVVEVQSFGDLKVFRPENRPEGSTERCSDCPLMETCAYSAVRIYRDRFSPGVWPTNHVIPSGQSQEELMDALRTGPYGRCVWACDNDVNDHQVVNMRFENGMTGSFTVTAFTPMSDRKTRIFGSGGFLEGDGETIRVYRFDTESWTEIDAGREGAMTAGGGHGGGDAGLMDAFIGAVADGNPERVLSSPRESLDSHLVALAAEKSRLTSTVVKL